MRAPDVVLSCDGAGCLAIPTTAPKIYCPAKSPDAGNHRYPPVTLAFPHLHYCNACWQAHMCLDDLLTDKVKARLEDRGRKIWPHGVTPDFAAALIQPIDVYSPEYGAYMQRIGLKIDGLGYSLHSTLRRRRLPGHFSL